MRLLMVYIFAGLLASACAGAAAEKPAPAPTAAHTETAAVSISNNKEQPAAAAPTPEEDSTRIALRRDSLLRQADSAWVDMELIAPDMVFDIRYATTNNFVGEVMYDCPKCFLRVATARAVWRAHENLKKQYAYRIKMYDCYRPQSVQYRLWKKVPDKRYVAPPDKGSQHNKGLAIDLTLVDKDDKELEMGTPFDYFGKEAYWSYTGHSAQINQNRQRLRSAMEKQGFGTSSTEWWHYSYRQKSFPVSNYLWDCK